MAIGVAGALGLATATVLAGGAIWSPGGAPRGDPAGVGAITGVTVASVRYDLAADARFLSRATLTLTRPTRAAVSVSLDGRRWHACSGRTRLLVCELGGVRVRDARALRVVAAS